MAKIKKIKTLKNKVVISFYDEEEKLEISKDIFVNYYLYEGKEVSKKELKKIKEDNDSISYLSYALKLRQKALYSEYKMREKLYDKGANKEQVDKVIKTLKANDLIDDDAFIEDFVEYYNSLNYGKNKIKTKLLEKGIFEDRVSKISFPVTKERKKAQNIFPKLLKKYEKYNSTQKKQHIYQAYLAMGFDSDIAKEMVDKVVDNSPKEENEKLKKDFDKIHPRYVKKYSKKELRNKIISHLLSKGYKMKDIIALIERKGL